MNLRPMLITDADFLLEMKNYKETRKYAIISKEEIKREDHLAWLKDNIQYFQIIMGMQQQRIGAIRIVDKEISVWIARVFWGDRIATCVLKEISENGSWCKIVEGNVFSMRAFINAGFKPISYHDNYYIFQK